MSEEKRRKSAKVPWNDPSCRLIVQFDELVARLYQFYDVVDIEIEL